MFWRCKVAVESCFHPAAWSDRWKTASRTAGIFYSLTFDPPLAAHADEYHSLQVEVNQPSLTVDTSKGYYNQPFYNDLPDTRIRRVTVSQLEQILQATHGGASVARQLSDIALTERLSQIKLQSLLAQVHDKKLREALELIANESTFLDSPSAELSADAPPDQAEQQRILKAAADYSRPRHSNSARFLRNAFGDLLSRGRFLSWACHGRCFAASSCRAANERDRVLSPRCRDRK